MWMSAETIATIGVGVTILVATLTGFAWTIRRTDAAIDTLQTRMDARFASVESRFASVESRFASIQHDIDAVHRELVEVKIAVARIEGPERRFLTAR